LAALQAGDPRIAIIDLGPSVKDGLRGGLHPNDRGYATFAAKIIPQMLTILNSGSKCPNRVAGCHAQPDCGGE
jgi:hypothetical protein